MRIINFSDARNSLRSVIDQVVEDADVTVIARRDAPDAVIMSFDHYSSLMETLRLLSSPANAAHLAKSIAQLRSGQSKHRELVSVSQVVDVGGNVVTDDNHANPLDRIEDLELNAIADARAGQAVIEVAFDAL